jgi:sulfur transfer protein SufE
LRELKKTEERYRLVIESERHEPEMKKDKVAAFNSLINGGHTLCIAALIGFPY